MTTYDQAMRARPGLRPRCSRIIVLEPDDHHRPTKIGEYNTAHYTSPRKPPPPPPPAEEEEVPTPAVPPPDCDAGCSGALMCGLEV